jgi:TfoX/Sxy family transcriptional regulator of competence genes
VERMEEILQRRRGISRRRMFGGTCFLVNGNMACGVTGDGTLMVRVGAARHEAALALKGARPMDFTGRPMKGFVFVGQPHLKKTDDLKAWVLRGLEFGRALPAK